MPETFTKNFLCTKIFFLKQKREMEDITSFGNKLFWERNEDCDEI